MQKDMDLAEIARGRRITAVTTSELNLTPRQSERPKPNIMRKLVLRAKRLVRRAAQ